MLIPNSRTEHTDNGIHFYENDILYDDFELTGNVQIDMTVEFNSPGIGFVLFPSNENDVNSEIESCLLRVGYKEASIVYSSLINNTSNYTNKTLISNPVNVAPYKDNMNLTLVKEDNMIALKADGVDLLKYYASDTLLDKFKYGIYSNKDNTIKNIKIQSDFPDKWSSNAGDIKGAYLKFFKNGFEIDSSEECYMQHVEVPLKAGVYYFSYINEDIKGMNDIVPYIFNAADSRIYDEDKNILGSDSSFVLKDDSSVVLKFKGSHGIIKNMKISQEKTTCYTESTSDVVVAEPSSIQISKENFVEVRAIATMLSTNSDGNVIKCGDTAVKSDSMLITSNIEYNYLYNKNSNSLTVSDMFGKLISSCDIYDLSDTVTLFENMDMRISKFIGVDEDGQVINLIMGNLTRKYVPDDVTSPVIIMDSTGEPLNLSSSIRIKSNGVYDEYVFTNTEREYFENPTGRLRLSNKISSALNAVKIYGVSKGTTYDLDKLLYIKDIDNIDMMTKDYIMLTDDDIKNINRENGTIVLKDTSNFSLVVVDYIKRDSYCINHDEDKGMYSIDISSEDKNISIIYDTNFSRERYKLLDDIPVKSEYLVIRKDGF